MMDNFKKIREVLNDLIKINKDREEVYVKASRELTPAEHNLRGVFERKAQESRNNMMQLQYKAAELNPEEDIETDDSMTGRIYRLWMDVKSAFTADDNKSILESCADGEKAAQHCYANALDDGDLPEDVTNIIREQKQSIDSFREEIHTYLQSEP